MQKRIPDSLSPDAAWKILASHPPLQIETRSIDDALHFCLAENFSAPENLPASPRSFMDGFAVRALDVARVPARLKKSSEVLMGEMPDRALMPGEAMPIPTGGFLPAGSDAVVMQEETESAGMEVIVNRAVSVNENVQVIGEDFKKDHRIFPAGHRLRPQDLSVIAAFGVTQIRVIRRPKIFIISTGNELVPFSATAGPAQIRETNSLALRNAAEKFGFHAESTGIIPDEMQAQQRAMSDAIQQSEVILVSGGSSVGVRDLTLEVIESFTPHEVYFHGLAIRPGNPTIFARASSSWIFGLPGQPVSSLFVFYQFVLPFLFHIAGEKIDYRSFHETRFQSVNAKLNKAVKPLKAKTDYLRVKLERAAEEWAAEPVLGKSASLSTLALADGFAILPPGEEVMPEGSLLKVYLFP
jgi:molybdopterin molybdotransferase